MSVILRPDFPHVVKQTNDAGPMQAPPATGSRGVRGADADGIVRVPADEVGTPRPLEQLVEHVAALPVTDKQIKIAESFDLITDLFISAVRESARLYCLGSSRIMRAHNEDIPIDRALRVARFMGDLANILYDFERAIADLRSDTQAAIERASDE